MATNYNINYEDKRFTTVEKDKKAALTENEKTYNGMINNADKYYDKQIQAAKDYATTQKKNQQEQTDFAIDKIEQQKAQAKKDYLKEQAGAYVDWQKQADPYGVESEKKAAAGFSGAVGYLETLQSNYYNTYQNRVATARESYQLAVLNYDNAIKDARLQNNAMLAEIAYNALQKQLELSLQGFQYKNQLLLDKAKTKRDIDNTYYGRYQDVLQQINHENALKEQVRQADLANKRQMEQIKIAQRAQSLDEQKFAYQKAQDKKSSSGGGSGGGGYTSKKSSGGSSKSSKKSTDSNKTVTKTTTNNGDAVSYLNKLIASGASKDKVSNEIAIALREGAITKQEAAKLRSVFTPRGLAY